MRKTSFKFFIIMCILITQYGIFFYQNFNDIQSFFFKETSRVLKTEQILSPNKKIVVVSQYKLDSSNKVVLNIYVEEVEKLNEKLQYPSATFTDFSEVQMQWIKDNMLEISFKKGLIKEFSNYEYYNIDSADNDLKVVEIRLKEKQ